MLISVGVGNDEKADSSDAVSGWDRLSLAGCGRGSFDVQYTRVNSATTLVH